MPPVLLAWLQFAVCAALIGAAGYRLSLYGDVIAEKTGLGRNWIGLVMLASAISAMMMNGVAIVGLLYRSPTRTFRTVGWVSLFLLVIYLFNSYVLFLHGE